MAHRATDHTISAVSRSVAPLLALDPDLGARIHPSDWEAARHACRDRLLVVPAGRWIPAEAAAEGDQIVGLLIVEGLLGREAGLRDRHMLELLGPGDVLQLPVLTTRPRLAGRIDLTVVNDLKLAVLGQAFIRASARWPSLLASVHRRLEAQRENLAIQGLIAHLPKVEHRVLLTLSHLAERFGHVTGDGTVLRLALSHEVLGQLAAARRSTTTLAVSALTSDGLIRRLDDGAWLVTTEAERRIGAILRAPQSAPLLGEQLRLNQSATDLRNGSRALRAEAAQVRVGRRRRPGANGH